MNTIIDLGRISPNLEDASRLMGMLSQPMRLKVLCHLMGKEMSVQELTDICGLSQPAMSHHLAKLRAADLVTTRRDGQSIYYQMGSKKVETLLLVLQDLYRSDRKTNRR